MTAPELEQVLLREAEQRAPFQDSDARVQRHVWESRYGPVLIEVAGDKVFVNGRSVELLQG